MGKLDPEIAGHGCKRLIASVCLLAWKDAVNDMGTYREGEYTREWHKQARSWIGSYQYCKWMELLNLDPNIPPEELIEQFGPTVILVMNE